MNHFQSALNPAGTQAAHIAGLWWVLLTVASLVYAAVIVALAVGAITGNRRWRADKSMTPAGANPAQSRRMGRIVGSCVAATGAILFVFLFVSVRTGRAIATPPRHDELLVEITAHQWWWEVQYVDTSPANRLTTANELHVPVKRPVRIRLDASDVIHSFWVPNLTGKRDNIPGNSWYTWFQADTPGVYRGQCAEYCGLQHAKMALWIVAEPESTFGKWYAGQLHPLPPPTDSVIARGREVFAAASCAMCHGVQGVNGGTHIAPDLSHIGSRLTLGAGTLRNTPDNLARWIVNPQSFKPGVRMPLNALADPELRALVQFLESLK